MNILDPLVRRSPEKRSTIDDYLQWVAAGSFSFNGSQHPLSGVHTTMQADATETIGENFVGHVQGALKTNSPIWSLSLVRAQVFSQARFQFRRLRNGRPGDLFGTQALRSLEAPEHGLTTGDLMARMSLNVDMAGNYYAVRDGNEIVWLRPDWVDILLAQRVSHNGRLGYKRVGYIYWPQGKRDDRNPAVFLAEEVAHFAPYPDPLDSYRGMSWITPVVREIRADQSATKHKLKFFDNAATPNMAVTLASDVSPDAFAAFVDKMDEQHGGIDNAYKTLYLAGGADVTVVGADMQQLDFKVTQGAGESRLAAAAGVGAVIAQFSEGMQGSSLNSGNYNAAKRRFADVTMRHLWQNAAGSLATLIDVPNGSELWYDDRDIPFLQEDRRDAAEIEQAKAVTIRQLVDGGFDPVSVIAAVQAEDMALLSHTGLLSVQLQEPGTEQQGGDMPPAMTDDEGEAPSD